MHDELPAKSRKVLMVTLNKLVDFLLGVLTSLLKSGYQMRKHDEFLLQLGRDALQLSIGSENSSRQRPSSADRLPQALPTAGLTL